MYSVLLVTHRRSCDLATYALAFRPCPTKTLKFRHIFCSPTVAATARYSNLRGAASMHFLIHNTHSSASHTMLVNDLKPAADYKFSLGIPEMPVRLGLAGSYDVGLVDDNLTLPSTTSAPRFEVGILVSLLTTVFAPASSMPARTRPLPAPHSSEESLGLSAPREIAFAHSYPPM